jgi:competence protein ComEC
VLALSGLHLGILYFVLSLLMLGRRQAFTRVVLILAVWSFAFLVGLPVSVVRSALMISLFALFSLGGRGHASINVLCFSAIITLCLNPDALYDIGFQLSYMTVFSILTVLPLMECWVSARWVQRHAVLGRLWSIVAVTLAAQMGVGPLLAFYFGRFSVLFLLTNLFVLPLAWLILTGALVFLLLSGVTWLAQWLATVLLWLVSLMNGGLSWLSRLSIVSVDGLQPTVSQVFICYVMIVSVYVVLLMVSGKRIRLF